MTRIRFDGCDLSRARGTPVAGAYRWFTAFRAGKRTATAFEGRGSHDHSSRPAPDGAPAAVGPGSGRRRSRPGADGWALRRDVDAHELHVPVLQLPQPPGRASVLRPDREHRRRGVRPHRARRRDDQHDADRREPDRRRKGAERVPRRRQGCRQPAPLPRRWPGRAAAGFERPSLERRLRLLVRRPRRGPDPQLLPRDGRAPRGPRADRLPARARRRPSGRVRTGARAPDGRRPDEDVPGAADPDREDPRVQAAHRGGTAPEAVPVLARGLPRDRRRVQRAAPRDGRGARGHRRLPGRGTAERPAGAAGGLRARLRAGGDRRDRGQAPRPGGPAQGADGRRRERLTFVRRGHVPGTVTGAWPHQARQRGTRRVPAAFQVATASSPSLNPRRAAEAAVTSAVTAPTVTRTRFATGTTAVTRPRTWFCAESAGESGPTVTSQG